MLFSRRMHTHADHDHARGHHAIDIHAHIYPSAYIDLIRSGGAPFGAEARAVPGKGPQLKVGAITTQPIEPRFTDLDARIAAMDAQGVEAQVLSLSLPMVEWADATFGLALAAAVNDSIAADHERRPTRVFGLATLPWHAPELAVRELERAAKLPGIRGVYCATRVREDDLSSPALFPIYERIEALGLPLFLHPVEVIGHARLERFYLGNLLGNPFETAIAAAHLIFGGVLDRYPRLDVCLPHAGGAFPYLVWRLNRGWQKRADLQHTKLAPPEYLRRFYYDTVGYAHEAHAYLVGLVGADRVMMGSDFCFPIAYERPVEIVTEHPSWSAADKRAILAGNARRLLRIQGGGRREEGGE
jgi:aminocarboxymuconate-semialdehyde decarboxylase